MLLAEGRSLTELPSVGPWVARIISTWVEEEREPPERPPLRRGFLTRAEVEATLNDHPQWREGLRADLQMHTEYSDGSVSVGAMVDAASAYGYTHVAITDHSVGLPIANGMSEERLALQAGEIERVNAELEAEGAGIRALRGIEMNLSPEGEGDMEPASLARLELVLGAFHSKLRLTEDQTERYLAALRNATVDVLAHPRGRMYGRRLGLNADWKTVFGEAAERGTALEIDANPARQDLDVERLHIAREAGVWISIGTDAHYVRELDYMPFALAAAARAGIARDRVLNLLSRDELLAWVADRRQNVRA